MKSSFAYILAPFLGWFVAQVTKNLIGITGNHGRIEKYMTSGGMPSAHTATVTALVTVIFVNEGFSALFAVAATFAAVTIYDALVARRSVGEQGLALVKLLKDSPHNKDPLPRVALGHRPIEVVAGAGVGVIIGIIVALFITI